MSPAVKNGLLLLVLLVVLGAAGFLFTRGNKERSYPNDPSTITRWMCQKCHKHFELTAAQHHDWLTSSDKVKFVDRVPVFRCPDCADFTVVRAMVNPANGEWMIPGAASEAKPAAKPKAPAGKDSK